MEVRKVLSNKLFLLGVVCGLFIVVSFISGYEYAKSLDLQNKAQINSEQQDSTN
jgi:hypothetical protein